MSEIVTRAQDGSVKIISQLGATLKERKGYEKSLLSAEKAGVEIVDGQKWERMHSQGPITGHESKHGIVYAPFEVNRTYQEHGIEEELRQMYKQKAPDVELELETVTECHPGTRRLSRIQYKVTALRSGQRTLVFERALNVGNQLKNPTVIGDGRGLLDLEPFLKPISLSPARARMRSRIKMGGFVHIPLINSITSGIVLGLLGIALLIMRQKLEERIIKSQLDALEKDIENKIAYLKDKRAEIQLQGGTPHANITLELVVSRFTDISSGFPITDQTFPVITCEKLEISRTPSTRPTTKYMKPSGVVRNYFVAVDFALPVPVTTEELAEYQQMEKDFAWLTELMGDSSLDSQDMLRVQNDYAQLQRRRAEWLDE